MIFFVAGSNAKILRLLYSATQMLPAASSATPRGIGVATPEPVQSSWPWK